MGSAVIWMSSTRCPLAHTSASTSWCGQRALWEERGSKPSTFPKASNHFRPGARWAGKTATGQKASPRTSRATSKQQVCSPWVEISREAQAKGKTSSEVTEPGAGPDASPSRVVEEGHVSLVIFIIQEQSAPPTLESLTHLRIQKPRSTGPMWVT